MLKLNHSIERLIGVICISVIAVIGLLTALWLKAEQVPVFYIIIILSLLMLVGYGFWRYLHNAIIGPLFGLTSQIEAIRKEEYNLRAKSTFDHGITAVLHTELDTLVHDLQQHKDRYNQHLFIVHRLIENINTPILIFNQANLLTHANPAFSMVYGKPWETARLWHSKQLALQLEQDQWQLTLEGQQSRWQIRSSQWHDRKESYQMLIFSDIQSIVKHTRQHSWQQVIRVLSHEINNSLSPIRSLAQTMQTIEGQSAKAQKALNVIVERSSYLQQFVSNYAKILKPLAVNKQWFAVTILIEKLQQLFPDNPLKVSGKSIELYADPVLFEQVMINLLRNAIQASDANAPVSLYFYQSNHHIEIELIDQGQGIANTANLFVPFYSTKEDGQGIGLGLSRHIIEEHLGDLSLANRTDAQGAKATIRLPLPQAGQNGSRDNHQD